MGITKGATREFIEDAMTSPKTNGYGAVWIFDHTSRMNTITDALFIPKTLKSVTPSIELDAFIFTLVHMPSRYE